MYATVQIIHKITIQVDTWFKLINIHDLFYTLRCYKHFSQLYYIVHIWHSSQSAMKRGKLHQSQVTTIFLGLKQTRNTVLQTFIPILKQNVPCFGYPCFSDSFCEPTVKLQYVYYTQYACYLFKFRSYFDYSSKYNNQTFATCILSIKTRAHSMNYTSCQ
jgi:hypothetical protein